MWLASMSAALAPAPTAAILRISPPSTVSVTVQRGSQSRQLGDFLPAPNHIFPTSGVPTSSSWHASLPTGDLLASRSRAPSSVDLSTYFDADGVDDLSSSEAARAAAALKARTEEENRLKSKRAETAIRRMEELQTFQAEQRAANDAKGLPPCPKDGPWGSNTGLLSSQVCARDRDGFIEGGQRTGFFVVF
jgi:hypothetical protein